MAIYKKLLAFQKLDISVKKDGKNPHFKSNYATLNEVLDKVTKPLNELGMVIVQRPCSDGLETIIVDTEAEKEGEGVSFVRGFMSYVDISTAQKLGSANTYARRYSLVTLLGLGDEDDDGNRASEPTVQYAPKNTPKTIVAPKKTPFERASEAIDNVLDEESMVKVEKAITDSTNLTDVEKATLLTKLDARAQIIPE